MNNLSSYCGLVDAKIRASDKDLPVSKSTIWSWLYYKFPYVVIDIVLRLLISNGNVLKSGTLLSAAPERHSQNWERRRSATPFYQKERYGSGTPFFGGERK